MRSFPNFFCFSAVDDNYYFTMTEENKKKEEKDGYAGRIN